MQQYQVHGTGDDRILVVLNSALFRYKFRDTTSGEYVKFTKAGGKALAKVGEGVQVYKKPKAQAYHRELMKQNGIALYRGLSSCNSEQLLDNMLEFQEEI